MKKIVLTYGLASGAVFAIISAITTPLFISGKLNVDNGEIFGYTSMVLAFVLVFVGIRSYREREGGGAITFGRAFLVGILITLISSAIYVASWEVVYHNFFPDFGEKYAAQTMAKLRAEGAPPEKIAAKQKQMTEIVRLYKNPAFNVAMTFVEVFPVGLIVTLISAAILRKRKPVPAPPAVALA
jgi:hypothetical protein